MKASTKSVILFMAAAYGASSVAYLEVWMRRLALILGRTPLANATALAVFFAGLAIGSWIWGRRADRLPRSLMTVSAGLGIATGFYGFASPWIFSGIEGLYLTVYPSLATHTGLFAVMQFLLTAPAILLPAILMGGQLPLLARLEVLDASGTVGSAGSVYGCIALGAASGVAATTYGLVAAVGLNSTAALAAAVNLIAGGALFAAERRSRKRNGFLDATTSAPFALENDSSRSLIEFLILISFALLGFATATFERVWARLFDMMMGSSVYVHGTLIVVILAGMGLGSALYGRAQRTTEGHQQWFAILEFLAAFTAALSMIVLPRIPVLFLHYFPLIRDVFGRQILAYFAAAALMALVPAVLLGATFPAATGSFGDGVARFGRTISAVFVANTIGVLSGVCVAGLFLIPSIGLHGTMIVGVLVAVAAGAAVWWRVRPPGVPDLRAVAPATAALVILVGTVHAWPREVFTAGIGFFAPRLEGESVEDVTSGTQLVFYRDGASSTISVDESGPTLFYRTNGKTEASTDPVDVANQLLLGHLPMLLHPAPRNVAVLGLGSGITAAAVARYPVERIDVIEMEPAARQAARYFDSYTRKVLDDPRVHLTIGDGRNRLRGMPQQYDVVISDLSDVWVSGADLYATIEFYRIVGARLKAGGVFAQRIDTHALLTDELDRITASFHAVFPHMQIWTSGPGNLILLGTRDAVLWDYARLKRHFGQTTGVADDLKSAGFWYPYALFGGLILGENESDSLARDVGNSHMTDNHPVLEFRAPRSLYAEPTPMIMDGLNYYRRPDPSAIDGFDPRHDLDADGTYLLGFAYASLGRSDLAITYMKRSTTMAPNSPVFLVGLGNQYRLAGRVAEADATFERALSLDINNVEALLSLGEIRLDEGQLEWTRVLSNRALELAPQDARVHALIGRLQAAER